MRRNELKPGWLLLAFLISLGVVGHISWQDEMLEQKVRNLEMSARNKEMQDMSAKVASKGAVDPDGLARAVHGKKRAKVLAAIALHESRGDRRAVGKKMERGAFQVRPELHGQVPNDLARQADQAEKLLEELIREQGSLKKAVRAYNGTGAAADRYAMRVLKLAKELGV
jgi:hypothetical protein